MAINQAKISFGENGVVLAEAGKVGPPRQPSTTTDVAASVNGDANATATNTAQVGILDSSVATGLNGTITATAVADLAAKATTTTGNTSAAANFEGPVGAIVDDGEGEIRGDLQIGTNGVVNAALDANAGAVARAITGDSTAQADVGQAAALFDINLKAGMGTSLTATAQVGLDTKAGIDPADGSTAVTGNVLAQSGSRGSDGTRIAGIYDSGARDLEISFGKSANITAIADASLSAAAQTVSGNAQAANAAELVAAIASDSTDSLKISVGENDPIVAAASLSTDAAAATVSGDAQAITDIGTVAGIIGESTEVSMGLDGSVAASAVATNRAQASSTSAETEVRAQIDNDQVVGIAIEKLSIGSDANALTALASSSQNATAQLVGPADPPDVIAKVASGDVVVGIAGTTVAIGENLTENANANLARASLQGTAIAQGVSSPGEVKAKAGVGSVVAGLQGGSLSVGKNVLDPTGGVPGTIDAYATNVLNAQAGSTAGNAVAKAGTAGMGTQLTTVDGIAMNPVSIGENGNLSGLATAVVNADASSVNANAEADAGAISRGILDSDISIGKNGAVVGATGVGLPLSGSAKSRTTTGNAMSDLSLEGDGIKQRSASISIGEAGSVDGSAVMAGSAQAETITGQASSSAMLSGDGIDLGDGQLRTSSSNGASSIKVGTIGDVSGTAVIGTRNPLTNALETAISAETTSGDAATRSQFEAAGIAKRGYTETDGRSVIQAGPLGGDISGVSEAGGQTSALAVTGMADASTMARLDGIDGSGGLDLQAGLLGINRVQGKASGAFETSSITVNGDATAVGETSAFGILGDGLGKILLSGNLEAMAALTNTVMAMTTTGNATAAAHTQTVGLQGYDVQILGSGTLTASAMSNTSSYAATVNGSVNAI